MTVSTNSSSLFPVMYLQPVTDTRDTWVALALHLPSCDKSQRAVLLSRILNEYQLAEALGRLYCIVQVDDIAGFSLPLSFAVRPAQIILRVSAAQSVDPALADDFERLKKEGFAFMADSLPPEGRMINEYLTMLAVSEQDLSIPRAAQLTSRLSGPHLAEYIHTNRQYDAAKAIDVSWFAGRSAAAHVVEMSQSDTIARTRLLRLLELIAQDANISELEVLLKQDPALSYQLFRLLGSAAFAFKVEITSFTQAINLLGRRQLQRWLQLLLYARPAGTDGIPNSLLPRAAARGAFMEALCRARSDDSDVQDQAFLIGMFSLLDELFGMPLAQVLQPLKLGHEIMDALLERQGDLGALLRLAEHAEYDNKTEWNTVDLSANGLTVEMYCHSLVHAYRWASRVSNEE